MSKREFSFSDGKSDKFWNIEVVDDETHVIYGRTGTAGQNQTKSLADNAAAQSAADKLIAEKLKKGYVEAASNGAAPASTSPAAKPKAQPVPQAEAQPVPQAESAPEPELRPEPVPDASAPIERVLHLEPTDWLWATWRPRAPQTRPATTDKPFDLEDALKRMRALPAKSWWMPWNWSKAKLSLSMSREEAHFWFIALCLPRSYQQKDGSWAPRTAEEIADQIRERRVGGELSVSRAADMVASLESQQSEPETELMMVLSVLFSPPDVVEIVLQADEKARTKQQQQRYSATGVPISVCEGFREYLLPFLSDAEMAAMREQLRPELDLAKWPSDFYESPRLAFHLGALLGMHHEIAILVASWKDDLYTGDDWMDHYHRPQEIVFGLGSAAEVSREMRRLKLELKTPELARAWLAHTEFADLDWLRDCAQAAHGSNYRNSAKDVVAQLVEMLALAEAPEAAPPMLQLMLESKAPKPARAWLEAHPLHAVAGLTPLAAGRGKLAEAAVEWLRGLKKRGFEAHIQFASQSLPDDARARIEAQILDFREKTYAPFAEAELPAAVRDALTHDKSLSRTKPAWISAHDLPPVTFGERKLGEAHVEALLSSLQKSKPGEAHALVAAVKASADRTSLDAFAWHIFERWLSEGAPSKEKWGMLAVGHLGSDESALKLTPLIRAWPGESQHQRAVTGLEVLRAIGTDTALMQINGIATKAKFKGLQGKAVECMEGIAQDRGLSRAQLEDRVVPDLDLDERGTRVLDFGPRSFKFVLGPDMKPLVREAGTTAKPRPDLPKPNAKDDATKAEAAVAEWKLLKKQISEVAKVQAVRLEQAMVTGRLWTIEEFEMLLVKHPLMVNLARLLVWEAASGNRRATFRVTEDGSYANAQDEAFDLQAGQWAHIGIAHPLHIAAVDKSAWGELFSDYEIVPPFPQIGRPIFALEGDEIGGKEITRFAGVKVPPETLNFGLEKLGWQVGELHDHGDYYEHLKTFESAGVTACVNYEPGLFKGYREGWEPQTMTRCFFVSNPDDASSYASHSAIDKGLPLSDIDPVAVSEVLKDLSEIAARGTVA